MEIRLHRHLEGGLEAPVGASPLDMILLPYPSPLPLPGLSSFRIPPLPIPGLASGSPSEVPPAKGLGGAEIDDGLQSSSSLGNRGSSYRISANGFPLLHFSSRRVSPPLLPLRPYRTAWYLLDGNLTSKMEPKRRGSATRGSEDAHLARINWYSSPPHPRSQSRSHPLPSSSPRKGPERASRSSSGRKTGGNGRKAEVSGRKNEEFGRNVEVRNRVSW